MSVTKFGVAAATDPTTPPTSDSSLIRASTSGALPSTYARYDPDGIAIGKLDGTTHYNGKAVMTVHYEAVLISEGKDFFDLYYTAMNTTNGLVWVARWNLKVAAWDVAIATMLRPNQGEPDGLGYVSFEMTFDGLDINTGGDTYRPGQVGIPSYSGVTFDQYFGRGAFGSGNFGQ